MATNYLIIGNDEYIRDKEALKIRDKFLGAGEIELNYSVYTPDNADGIMNSLGTMPFLSDKRVVLIKDAEGLSDDLADTLISYLNAPSDTGVLVLSCAQSFKKTKKYKALKELLTEIGAAKPDIQTIKGWVRTFFRKENIDIAPQAVDLIMELKGDDTTAVKMELEKLLAFSGGEAITVKHVEDIVGRSVTEAIYSLVDAIDRRDGKWAYRILEDMYDQKKRPQEILGYLGNYIKKIKAVKLLGGERADPGAVAAAIGTKSTYYAKRMSRESRKYPAERVERWLSLLLETDRDIKTGKRTDRLAMDMLIPELMG